MKNILVFGASNSKKSINKQLAFYAGSLLKEVNLTKLDLNDFEMPIYGIDKETEYGIPQEAINFKKLIKECDGIIISFAEHNGNVTAAFKNVFDWVSRIEGSVWEDKPMLLLATSPGARGGSSALKIATSGFPFRGGVVTGSFSLPSFNDNFSIENGITNSELKEEFLKQLNLFLEKTH